MVKIFKIVSQSGDLAGFIVEDENNKSYIGLHSFVPGDNALVSVANQISLKERRFLTGQFHPGIAILPSPQPIPQRVKDIFFQAYRNTGVPSIVMGNDYIAYVMN